MKFYKQEQNLPYWLAFGLPSGLMLLVMLISGSEPFFGWVSMLYSDMYHQYFPFWVAFGDAVRSGEGLLWDWSVGLGMDYLSLISYYLASPLNLLAVITPKGWELEVFSLLMPLKLGLAGLSFCYFLEKIFGHRDTMTGLFGAFYGLCAWALAFQWNVMWLDTFALLPVTVLGTLWLLRDKKPGVYVLTLFLSIFSNYYIGFFVCIFILLLFFVYEICRWRGFKRLVLDFFRIGWFTVLAVGMTAILELPALAGLQNTQSSVNAFPEGFKLNIANENTLLGLLDALRQVAGNTLGGLTPSFKEGLPNLYCGVGCTVLAIVFLTCREVRIRDKILSVGLLLFFMVSFIIRQLDYIWHGFHFTNMIPYRFSFLYCFVVLYMAYRAWTLRRSFRLWQIITAGIGGVVFLVCSENRLDPVFLVYNLSFFTLYLGALAYATLRRRLPALETQEEDEELLELYAAEQSLRRRRSAQFIAACFCLELVVNVVNFGIRFSYTGNTDYPKGTSDTAAMLAIMESRESEHFYRTETTHTQTLNDGALNGYNGISTFTSSANVKTTEFMQALGYGAKNTYNRYAFEEGSPVANLFLNLKYMLERGAEMEENRYFDEIAHSGQVYLLENNAYLPLGFLAEAELADLSIFDTNHFQSQNELFRAATGLLGDVWHPLDPAVDGKDVNISSINGPRVKYSGAESGSSITYTFTADKGGFFCLDFDVTDRNSYTVYHNGNKLYSESLSLTQMIAACDVVLGDEIQVVLTCKDGEEGRMTVRGGILDDDLFRQGWNILNASTLELTSFESTHITGTIHCNRDGLLYTSVPQDGNWSIWVDGKEAKPVLVGDVMLCTELTAGTHDIELRYHNRAFSLGWKVSCLCLALAAATIPIYHRSKKGKFEK